MMIFSSNTTMSIFVFLLGFPLPLIVFYIRALNTIPPIDQIRCSPKQHNRVIEEALYRRVKATIDEYADRGELGAEPMMVDRAFNSRRGILRTP